MSGEVDPLRTIPLVVARFHSKLYMVFGNRRLKALKDATEPKSFSFKGAKTGIVNLAVASTLA